MASTICAPCTKANLVPLCVTNLTIATIADLATAVYVYQKHIGSGKITRYDITTGGAGEVIITPANIMGEQEYEYWVTLATATDIESTRTMTISGNTYECVTVEYHIVSDASDNTAETYTNITLTI